MGGGNGDCSSIGICCFNSGGGEPGGVRLMDLSMDPLIGPLIVPLVHSVDRAWIE
jgi:hypothetical protein